jgi:hypothetical protein
VKLRFARRARRDYDAHVDYLLAREAPCRHGCDRA